MKSEAGLPSLENGARIPDASAVNPRAPRSPPGVPHLTLIHRPSSLTEPLAIAELFRRSRPMEVELGSGDGSFLVQHAGRFPDRNFLGVERLLGRLRKTDRKAHRAGLANLRLIRIEASYFLEYLLPRASVTVLHVYFPDPWPKRKHRKNRLINTRFAGLVSRVLTAGGTVHLRTDEPDYFAQMNASFAGLPEFVPVETPPGLKELLTDFEKAFHERGIKTWHTDWQRT